MIDFRPIRDGQKKYRDLAPQFGAAELRSATHTYYDALIEIIGDADDWLLCFEPIDLKANDPAAKAGEENIAWSMAHLVLHVTASCEEGAAFSSLLARGITLPVDIRLRFEPDWKLVTTRAQVLARVAESRRMCLAYLDTWPESPNMETLRGLNERLLAFFGPLNAVSCYLLGLDHLEGHFDQCRDALTQARAARP